MAEVPDLLTVEEVARILRIGRTTAYQEVNRFTATGGTAGIPVIEVGGLKRIPRARLEALIGGPVHLPPPPTQRPPVRSAPVPAEPIELADRRSAKAARRSNGKTAQPVELPRDVS